MTYSLENIVNTKDLLVPSTSGEIATVEVPGIVSRIQEAARSQLVGEDGNIDPTKAGKLLSAIINNGIHGELGLTGVTNSDVGLFLLNTVKAFLKQADQSKPSLSMMCLKQAIMQSELPIFAIKLIAGMSNG